jgi:hypothetical protein
MQDSEVLPDERAQRGHRAAEFTAEHSLQFLGLFVGGLGVDDGAQPPVTVGHYLGCVGDDHYRKAAHICPLDIAVGDVEDHRRAAAVVVGAVGKIEIARTKEVARTGFDVRPPKFPRHSGIVRRSPFQGADSPETVRRAARRRRGRQRSARRRRQPRCPRLR